MPLPREEPFGEIQPLFHLREPHLNILQHAAYLFLERLELPSRGKLRSPGHALGQRLPERPPEDGDGPEDQKERDGHQGFHESVLASRDPPALALLGEHALGEVQALLHLRKAVPHVVHLCLEGLELGA